MAVFNLIQALSVCILWIYMVQSNKRYSILIRYLFPYKA
jgi:hypothetical protein